MYNRKCPSCEKELIYKGKRAYENAERLGKCCISCAKSGNTLSVLRNPGLWVRTCKQCGKERQFKSYRSWYNSKNVELCVSCAQKICSGHSHTEEHKQYMRELMIGRKVTWGDKIAKSHWARDKKRKKKIIEEHSKRMSLLIANGNHTPTMNKNFVVGFYDKKDGTREYYRSSYELQRMKELDSSLDVAKWTTKHRIRIPYEHKGIKRNYIPDFLIEYRDGTVILEEVKGYINDVEVHNKKIMAAEKWAEENNCKYKLNFMEKYERNKSSV